MLHLASPLPQYVGSLSKYIRAEKYYDLLSSITHDIPESQLRAKFDPNLYATAKARYLLIERGSSVATSWSTSFMTRIPSVNG